MRNALFGAFLLLFELGNAQVYFNNVYDFNEEQQFAKGVEIGNDSNYIILTATNDIFNIYQGLLLMEINQTGSLVSQVYHYDSVLNYFQELSGSLYKLSSNFFYSGGSYHNQITADANVILIFYNAELDTFSIVEYPSNTYDVCTSSSPTKDKGIVMIGQTATSATSGNPDWIIYRVDSNYNLLWTKTYGSGLYDLGVEIFEDANKNIIASGIKNLTISNETTWILKLDSDGNLIDQKEFDFDPYRCTEGRFTFLNENYLMCGCLDTVYNVNDNPHPVYVARLDTNFNVVWRSDFHGPEVRAISHVRQLSDSSIVFIGEKGNLGDVPLGWIVKLDKNGNTLWERTYYKSQTIDNYFADFQQTYDKGFIVTGSAFGPTQDVWLVKLDSMGCLDPNDCTFNTGTIEVGQEAISFNVFPNPASSYLNLLYNIPVTATDAVISMNDLSGRLINQLQANPSTNETIVDVSQWNNGMYLCTLEIAGQKMKSVKVLVIH